MSGMVKFCETLWARARLNPDCRWLTAEFRSHEVPVVRLKKW